MITITELLAPIVQFITSFISSQGYFGIFILMILESALIPIPSEVIMPFSGFLVSVGKLGSVGVVLAGSFGNLVGSIATYYLGLRFGRAAIIKYGKYVLFRKKHLEYTERLFEKYGEKIAFVGRLLPGVRTYVSLPAGIGLTGFVKFASGICLPLPLTVSPIEGNLSLLVAGLRQASIRTWSTFRG